MPHIAAKLASSPPGCAATYPMPFTERSVFKVRSLLWSNRMRHGSQIIEFWMSASLRWASGSQCALKALCTQTSWSRADGIHASLRRVYKRCRTGRTRQTGAITESLRCWLCFDELKLGHGWPVSILTNVMADEFNLLRKGMERETDLRLRCSELAFRAHRSNVFLVGPIEKVVNNYLGVGVITNINASCYCKLLPYAVQIVHEWEMRTCGQLTGPNGKTTYVCFMASNPWNASFFCESLATLTEWNTDCLPHHWMG